MSDDAAFDEFVKELWPQPGDFSTSTGFCSVSDLETVFYKVYVQFNTQAAQIAALEADIAALRADLNL